VGKAAGVTDHDVSQDGLPRLSTLVQNFSGQITDAVSGFVHSVAARATNGVGFLFHALINTNSELRLRTPGECRGDAIAGQIGVVAIASGCRLTRNYCGVSKFF